MAAGLDAPGDRLPAATRLGSLTLAVSHLERSLEFYEKLLGLAPVARSTAGATFAARNSSTPLLHLISTDRIERPSGPRLGLYHFALLVPDRATLGRFLTHLAAQAIRVASADHAVSEALYLWDPDGLGIEVYRDRPRQEWRSNGEEIYMTTESLDVRGVLGAADGDWQGMPEGTVLGHMHLSVSDLPRAEAFYHRALGFDKMVWSYPGALFMAAGGYHHHLGTNTWSGAVPTRNSKEAGLLAWEVVLPSHADANAAVERCARAGARVIAGERGAAVLDPWGTEVRFLASA